MKFTKLSAAGATIALAVGSVVGIGIAAHAIDVPIDEIGQEVPGGGYPEDQWFVGDPAGPALSQDETGLTIPGRNQLLYGWLEAGVTAEEFEAYIEGASFDGTGPLTFQVPVFLDASNPEEPTGFTTLQPAVTGSPSTSTEWFSSQSVGGLTAFQPYTFDQILEAFVGENAAVLAFGVFVAPEETALLRSVTWADETWTFATPTEVVPPVVPPAVVPTPIQKPVTFTG